MGKLYIKTIKHFINESNNEFVNDLDYNYKFDKSKLDSFIYDARKWNEKDFIEEYVYLNDITLIKNYGNINKRDEIIIGRLVKDLNGENVYKNSVQLYAPYKKVIADKDYGTQHWTFIMDNTKELQEEAKKLYNDNKNNKKPKLNKDLKIITGYHASPYKFEQFMYNTSNKPSTQLGSDSGFYFFKELKYAQYYANILKKNNGEAYIYTCDIKFDNVLNGNGEDIGTGWGRIGWLDSANNEGYDVVLIKNADTGYGITDVIIVFDDDNISIKEIKTI